MAWAPLPRAASAQSDDVGTVTADADGVCADIGAAAVPPLEQAATAAKDKPASQATVTNLLKSSMNIVEPFVVWK